MQKAPPTPKGFRDIDPKLAQKRREVINKIVGVLEEFGFVPIETPTIEFAQTLKGKYGEEERLIYEFKDRGGRDLALRYDLTVPLARYVATYNPPLPFRRYQIGQVFRGENPQKGRYREFTQLDFDTVGSDSIEEDANIIATAIKAVRKLGLNKAIMAVNDRKNFEGIPIEIIRIFDKIQKIKQVGVEEELRKLPHLQDQTDEYLRKFTNAKPTPDLEKIFKILLSEKHSLAQGEDFFFDKSLARGLDYYTGSIFELKADKNNVATLSIGSGGRYDNLIGSFVKNSAIRRIPAVGFSFGIDRLIEALNQK